MARAAWVGDRSVVTDLGRRRISAVVEAGRFLTTKGRTSRSIVRVVASSLVEFDCPRCSASVTEEFYGPCSACFTDLRAKYYSEGRVVEVAEYEPKMNVTPNAVALKDD